MAKKDKKSDKIELEQVKDDRLSVNEDTLDIERRKRLDPLVDSELNELVNPPSTGESFHDLIVAGIVATETLIANDEFRTTNPQSHRILGATLNMLKSARDHLGDR